MEGEIIIVSVITTIGGLFGLWLVNQNWYKRQEFKYKYLLKRQRQSQKGKLPSSKVPEPTTALGGIAQLLPLLKNLDADQLGGLVNKFIGDDVEEEGGDSSIDMLLDFAGSNPDIVKGLLEGIGKAGKGGGDDNQQGY